MKHNHPAEQSPEPETNPNIPATDKVYSRTYPTRPGKRAQKIVLVILSLVLAARGGQSRCSLRQYCGALGFDDYPDGGFGPWPDQADIAAA